MTFLHAHLIARELLSFFSARQRDKLHRKQSCALFAEYFDDRIKRKRSWPSPLNALNPCDFFLSDSVRDKFYICSPDAAGDLIGKIRNTVFSVPPSRFRSVQLTLRRLMSYIYIYIYIYI